MRKSKRKLLVDLFHDCKDKDALKIMYRETKNPLVNILIRWNEDYEGELDDYNTPQFYMYGDIINYVLDKYKIKL